MSVSSSNVTTTNSVFFDNTKVDDGATARIRDGQTFLGTAFAGLSVPAGATIDGIIVAMEGYSLSATHDADVGDWISVSNDGGTTFSTAQSVTTGTWSTNSSIHAVEKAGGATELWGMSWDADSANDIQVRMAWSTSNGDAVYLDYLQVQIYYTGGTSPHYTTENEMSVTNGIVTLSNGNITIS